MGRIEWTVTSGNILFLVALEQSQQKGNNYIYHGHFRNKEKEAQSSGLGSLHKRCPSTEVTAWNSEDSYLNGKLGVWAINYAWHYPVSLKSLQMYSWGQWIIFMYKWGQWNSIWSIQKQLDSKYTKSQLPWNIKITESSSESPRHQLQPYQTLREKKAALYWELDDQHSRAASDKKRGKS